MKDSTAFAAWVTACAGARPCSGLSSMVRRSANAPHVGRRTEKSLFFPSPFKRDRAKTHCRVNRGNLAISPGDLYPVVPGYPMASPPVVTALLSDWTAATAPFPISYCRSSIASSDEWRTAKAWSGRELGLESNP
jgi:hypothetical protein